ncbi:MAG TPA: ACT domain-containing protein [Erysipelothrix sp.]
MKAIVTVVGKDQVGIISQVSKVLAENNVNILDIDQSILEGYFNMFMIVDLTETKNSFSEVQDNLYALKTSLGVEITMQRTEVFETMHRVSGVKND